MAPLTNSMPVRIAWGDCDPAGIVFYPRYFEIFDACTAGLIERALGMTKFQQFKTYDFAGYPLVKTRGRFLMPLRFGDDVVVESTLTELRNSSFDIQHRVMKDGAAHVEGFETRVWVGHDPGNPGGIKSKPIPSDIAAKLSGN